MYPAGRRIVRRSLLSAIQNIEFNFLILLLIKKKEVFMKSTDMTWAPPVTF